MSQKKVALVTGGNRGLGLETCRQLAGKGYEVILSSRTESKGLDAAKELKAQGLEVLPLRLDITHPDEIQAAFSFVRERFGRLDVLVNNAGVLTDSQGPNELRSADTLNARVDALRAAMETNVYGAFQLCQRFVPLMLEKGYGRVVNISSGMGQLTEMDGGYPAYRLSKAGLNVVTRVFAAETRDTDVLVNSVCPGWVKTDMGGPGAERSLAEGADTIVWLATLPQGGPNGGFFRDREPIAW
jgi:NAD(P)-dependent dehydrogenase (short-subunit alcohol dehydrogenase family)